MITKPTIVLTAIIGVVILVAIAMLKGIDGAVYMSGLTIIGGLAGYEIKNFETQRIIKKLTEKQ